MTEYLTSLAEAPALSYDVGLLDLDGVVYRGPDAVPHAAAAIDGAQRAGLGVMYVTNNANRPPSAVVEHLTRLDIVTDEAHVTTAAQAAASTIAGEHPSGTKVLVIGGDGLKQAVTEAGLVVAESADERPAVVVQGFAPSVDWAQLTEGLLAIQGGAEHVATNLDATLPMERGTAIGNGSLVAAVANATGRTPRSTGKPQPEIFHQAAARAGARRPFVVGDRLDTDLEGARSAGYPGMHVLTGVDDAAALLRCPAPQRPSLVALDLRGLLVPHPAVVREGAWWRCGKERARVEQRSADRSEIVLATDGATPRALDDGDEIDLDQLRAACCAAWSAADEQSSGGPTPAVPVGIRVRERGEDHGAIA